MLHQGTHVVDAAHLLRQQNQGGRRVVALEGLHLDRDFVVGQGCFEEVANLLRSVLAIGVTDFALLFLQGVVEFRVNPLELQLPMAHLQPGDELGIDKGVCQQHFRALAFPEG